MERDEEADLSDDGHGIDTDKDTAEDSHLLGVPKTNNVPQIVPQIHLENLSDPNLTIGRAHPPSDKAKEEHGEGLDYDLTLRLPTTFNAEPNCVRRLSMSIGHPLTTGSMLAPATNANTQYVNPSKPYQRQPSCLDVVEDKERFPKLLKRLGGQKVTEKLRRITEKNGNCNVSYKNISKKRRKYCSDLYTTLVDSRWSTSLLLFATSFYMTWFLYGCVYYFICYIHGDFEENHLPDKQAESGWMPCIWQVDGFAAAFLFSLETQHTIGYGSRQTTTECAEAIIVMTTQSVLGCLIQAFMVGLVFAKLSTPNKRAKTVVFSKNAVINERDQKLCLLFRVGDIRDDSFIVGAQISAKIIRRRITEEGEMFHDVEPLEIKPDSANENCIFLIWPITVVHVIDQDSPFFKMSAPELAADKFEILITLEGTIEATSMTFQARSSYLPHEILWGHRFEPMMIYRRDHNKYQVNFAAFNSTYEVDTPLCSSRDLQMFYKGKGRKAKGRFTIGKYTNKHPPKISEEDSGSSSPSEDESSSESDQGSPPPKTPGKHSHRQVV